MRLSQPIAQPKPERRRTPKGRKDRVERTVRQSVRAQCVERDGDCRWGRFSDADDFDMAAWNTACKGPSEWAHLKGHRRSLTRGQAPEVRHTTAHSLMLCQWHHILEEEGRYRVIALTRRGGDGPVRFEVTR